MNSRLLFCSILMGLGLGVAASPDAPPMMNMMPPSADGGGPAGGHGGSFGSFGGMPMDENTINAFRAMREARNKARGNSSNSSSSSATSTVATTETEQITTAISEYLNTYQNIYPEECSAISAVLSSNLQSALEQLALMVQLYDLPTPQVRENVQPRDRVRLAMKQIDQILERRDPEAMAKLRKLRKTDPHEARALFITLVNKYKITPFFPTIIVKDLELPEVREQALTEARNNLALRQQELLASQEAEDEALFNMDSLIDSINDTEE